MTLSLGIDLGGSAIKAGAVDVADGRLVGEVTTRPTPQPATPAAVAAAVAALVAEHPEATGTVGFAFPSVVTEGIARTAANVDHGWVGCNGAELVERATGRRCGFLNDADAAGLAEMRFGAGRGVGGSVLVLTLGTGIGTALFTNGELWANSKAQIEATCLVGSGQKRKVSDHTSAVNDVAEDVQPLCSNLCTCNKFIGQEINDTNKHIVSSDHTDANDQLNLQQLLAASFQPMVSNNEISKDVLLPLEYLQSARITLKEYSIEKIFTKFQRTSLKLFRVN